MVQLNWTIQAVNDLKCIYDFIARDSKLYARKQIMAIKETSNQLKTQPYSGRVVPEVKHEDIREIFEGNYRIIYKIVHQKRIDILTVHHSARDFKSRNLLF
jgi:addiction module RelE/StbE family toxin